MNIYFRNALFLFLFSMIMMPDIKAQDAEAPVTDEELTRYAEVMDSVDILKGNVEKAIKDKVSGTEEISASRYNTLYKYSGNPDKLAELEATEVEISFLKELDHLKDSMTTEIKNTFSVLAKEYVGEGGKTYNRISRALKTDDELKARYQEILLRIKEERKAEESSEDN